jgi:hypothetical protein
MTFNDDECVGKPPEKLKSFHDEQAEHSTCRGCRTMRQRACTRCIVSIRIWNKEEISVVVIGCDACAKKKVECSSWEAPKTNGALKRNGAYSTKDRTESARDACRKTVRKTEQRKACRIVMRLVSYC